MQLAQFQPSGLALGGDVPTGGGEGAGKAALASGRFPSESGLPQRGAGRGRERGVKPLGARCLRALAASVMLFCALCGQESVLCKLSP